MTVPNLYVIRSIGLTLVFHAYSQWRYSLMTDKLTATMQIARRVYSLGQEHNDSALMLGAHRALAATLSI